MNPAQLRRKAGMALMALAMPVGAAAAAPAASPRIAVVAIQDSGTGPTGPDTARDRFGAALARSGAGQVLPNSLVESSLANGEERARRDGLAKAVETARRGRSLFEQLDFESSVKALEEARDGMEKNLGAQTDGALAAVLVDLGRAQLELGRVEAAHESFKNARAMGAPEDPPASLSPRGQSLWKEVVTSFRNLAKAQIDVTGDPAGVQVYLDGRPAGRAPLSLRGLAEGTHVLRGEAPGRRPKVVSLEILGGKPVPVDLSLTREPPERIDGSKGIDELFREALVTGQALDVDYLAAAGMAEKRLTWMVVDVKRRQTVLVGSSASPDPWEAAGIAAGERLGSYLHSNP